MKLNTHKEQAEKLRIALKEFLWSERQVRDLLLYYTPPSTLQKHQKVIAEIKLWFDNGTFRLNGKEYPFSPILLKEALKIMRSLPGFTPPGNESTGYLKKTMRTLFERQQQQRKAAGVQIFPSREGIGVGNPPLREAGGGGMNLTTLCHLKLKDLETIKEIDVSEIRAVLQDALETGTISKGFFEVLDRHLMETVRAQIGVEWDCLHEEVERWFVEYKEMWDVAVWEEAIESGFRQRLYERYGVPLWK